MKIAPNGANFFNLIILKNNKKIINLPNITIDNTVTVKKILP